MAENDEVYDKKPQHYAEDNVTQWLIWNLSNNKKDSARVILLRLTTDGHKVLHGLSAAAELLVKILTTDDATLWSKLESTL